LVALQGLKKIRLDLLCEVSEKAIRALVGSTFS